MVSKGAQKTFGFASDVTKPPKDRPLSDRLRPACWNDYEGLEQVDSNLVRQLKEGRGKPPSLILWGPPGSGKTTFAKLIGNTFKVPFVEFSAVLGGVKEVREIVESSKAQDSSTILFVDEIHRFNKAQQDAFLPHVENGTIILIGATTENPSFYVTGALLSRSKVVVFPSLGKEALASIARRALDESGIKISVEGLSMLIDIASGDARKLINRIEEISQSAKKDTELTGEEVKGFLESGGTLFYDRGGEEHYNIVSAFIKSLRGSDPDAALYWGFRMIEAGEDPRFVIRRLIIFASEDIGNADPRALQVAVNTADAFDRVGLPEGRIPIAHCITYLATAPKSNRSYSAMHKALDSIKEHGRVTVPHHLRNAPTLLMKNLGYGKEYQYPHDYDGAYVQGIKYLPEELGEVKFYEPSDRGYEKNIGERIATLRSLKK